MDRKLGDIMLVVIIDKTFKDSEKVKGPFAAINASMPDDYPMNCREEEWQSVGEARQANPNKSVMSAAAYNALINTLHGTQKDKLDAMDLKVNEINAAEEARRLADI